MFFVCFFGIFINYLNNNIVGMLMNLWKTKSWKWYRRDHSPIYFGQITPGVLYPFRSITVKQVIYLKISNSSEKNTKTRRNFIDKGRESRGKQADLEAIWTLSYAMSALGRWRCCQSLWNAAAAFELELSFAREISYSGMSCSNISQT